MANFQDIDLMAVGRHCSRKDCNRLDYLPIKCDHCNLLFCAQHHDAKEHHCQSFVNLDRVIPACPLCGQLVALVSNVSKNDQVEKHIRSGCKALIAEKRRKNVCSQMNCKRHSLIPFNCHICQKTFCVRHRHSGDHTCIPLPPTTIAVY
ncbi:AN1-type zinc finger protein 2B-like [Rhopilema esculentum]|uniref:AN1-type zinc finger protein 2B-like n=1 Tax=Rhopilema esculentum TaxID=499914 RepID=UPI0031D24128